MANNKRKSNDGRRILNDNIKRDYIRLLEIIADSREPNYVEVEDLANKYRLYFDDSGDIKEA